jgi:hypothetical protein
MLVGTLCVALDSISLAMLVEELRHGDTQHGHC